MNIYVGYLPENYTEQQLREKFAKFGRVSSVKIILDHETRKSKGFAFVQIKDDFDAQVAIDNLLGWEEEGKRIVVKRARDKREENGFSRKW